MSLPKDKAWFPAKRYGYGWGIPRRWQGWLVMLFFALALAGSLRLVRAAPADFVFCAIVLSAGLILICLWKGESPRWRWGEIDDPPAAGKRESKESSAETRDDGV